MEDKEGNAVFKAGEKWIVKLNKVYDDLHKLEEKYDIELLISTDDMYYLGKRRKLTKHYLSGFTKRK